jgi:hypothetical protein
VVTSYGVSSKIANALLVAIVNCVVPAHERLALVLPPKLETTVWRGCVKCQERWVHERVEIQERRHGLCEWASR